MTGAGGNIDVDVTTLDAASTELAGVASALKAADVAGPFEPIGGALPGSVTAEAALGVSTRIGAAVQVLGTNIENMSASASGSAAAYRATDARTQQRMAGMGAM